MKQYRADHGGSRIVTAGFYFLLVSYAAVSMIATLAGPVGKFDESIPLLHAMLIRQGYTPNLDFYSVYPPLNLYMNALAFSLLGRTVIAARAINSIFYAGVLALSGLYFGSRLRTWGPLVPAVLLVFAASIGGAIALPSWPGFALSLAALLVYLKSRQADQPRLSLVALSGVFAALAALCRINFGSYAIAAIGFDSLRRLLPNRAREPGSIS